MKLLIATNNAGKQKEFAKCLSDSGYELLFPTDVGLEDFDVEENGATAQENAFLKASQFAQKAGLLTVADDSGLEIRALDGAPGVHSKRFHPGSDADRNQRIFELLTDVNDRSALFRSVLCLYNPQTEQTDYFEGIFHGSISFAEKGDAGFGYDPIFIPQGETKTIAELGMAYKNDHSHRAIAIEKLGTFLKKH